MVTGDGVGTIESVDDPAGTEGIVALGVEKVLERATGEVAAVGPSQDHPLNQDLGRDVGFERKLRLFQERQAHQITHPVELDEAGMRLVWIEEPPPVRFGIRR